MLCDLVRTVTGDGLRLDGAMFAPLESGGKSDRFDAFVCIHGVASNFYSSSLFENLLPHLRDEGVPVLLANTRGHDTVHYAYHARGRRSMGAAFEVVDDCRRDLAAWLEFLDRQGLKRILLIGHSLGAIKIVHAAAIDPRENIQALIALSPPRLSGSAFRAGAESGPYLEALSIARRMVQQERGQELFSTAFPFPMLITAEGFIDKYGPDDRYNIVRHVPQLACPALFAYGQLELEAGTTAFAGIDEEVRAAARPGQPLETRVIAAADHNYTGQSRSLAGELRHWLAAQAASRT
ncbi:MAG: alpha/beta fold hydrolase [Planctomycetes bacterium]|nr:alpha/beta fold hydrolase [Planctomycetota bacterium]